MDKILHTINSPADLKGLSTGELETLCRETRDYIIECCSRNPGHLGSSLGAVEITVALHAVFNAPTDKIVFDVGHQAYAHKILTGRREAFKGIRTEGGISGFPKMEESRYDAFGTGHSSTAISAALGLAEAERIEGGKGKVVAVVGDGALTGGLAWEGLNNAGDSKADLLIILNDNNVSIDSNTGAVHKYLLKITTDPRYNKMKTKVWNRLGEGKIRDWLQKKVLDTKSNLVRESGGAMFEGLGFRYFGPVDGNDVALMASTLAKLRDLKGPRILHCITRKGKGYAPAENDPTVWHAPGKFDPATGVRVAAERPADRYQDVFGQVLLDMARSDRRVVGVTPAMATGCGMQLLEKEIPSQFFDVGIEEEHAVTFSAGLAAGGLRPFCNIYSSFSQRAYDEIIHDVALQKLPVVLCFDRAGLVGEDGATHHGCFDLAAYRSIPGCTIAAPRNENELKQLMYTALKSDTGPFIIRYPRGCGEGVRWKDTPCEGRDPGKGEKLVEGTQVAVLAIGPVANRAVEAAERIRSELGRSPKVFDMRYLKPLDTAILEEVASTCKGVVTVEDGCLKGGLYGAVCEYFGGRSSSPVVKGLGIPDRFIPHAPRKSQLADCGLDTDGIADLLETMMR